MSGNTCMRDILIFDKYEFSYFSFPNTTFFLCILYLIDIS